MEITLTGEPKSTQHIYKYRCAGGFPRMYMTAQGKSIKEGYWYEAQSQKTGDIFTGPVGVTMRIYFGTKRKADIDNFSKLVFDSLTGVVWVDDSQVQELTITKQYDKENPRVELKIYDKKM